MRITATAGLFVCALSFITISPKANAQSLELDVKKNTAASSQSSYPIVIFNSQEKVETPAKSEVKAVQTYVIKESETLDSIAKANNTTWKRLYDKNTKISNPDIVKPGEELTIPEQNETIPERAIPEPAPQPASAQVEITQHSTRNTVAQARPVHVSSDGNRYSYGYCTWYVKNQRPDLPNNLGNADTWVSNAAAQGYATGSEPRVGAVAQSGMHVAYVTSVNDDGTITVIEMNYVGWNQASSRTAPSSSFYYIY